MGTYEATIMIFNKEVTFNVRAKDMEDGERKIMDKPLLEVLSELKLDDFVGNYSSMFEED